MSSEDPSLLLETLSDRVLRHLSPAAWRKLFLRPHQEVMQFAPAHGTLLCATLPGAGWGVGGHTLADIAFLAACHGGQVDPCPEGHALVRFDRAQAAFNMAVELQQSGVHPRFQVGLVTGACTLALLALDEGVMPVLLGSTVERAGAVARLSAPGSIRIAPETFGALQEQLVDVRCGVLTTEYEQETMIAVSLTPTPHSTAHLSTFAGLGLT
jgi:hypothetical protein